MVFPHVKIWSTGSLKKLLQTARGRFMGKHRIYETLRQCIYRLQAPHSCIVRNKQGLFCLLLLLAGGGGYEAQPERDDNGATW